MVNADSIPSSRHCWTPLRSVRSDPKTSLERRREFVCSMSATGHFRDVPSGPDDVRAQGEDQKWSADDQNETFDRSGHLVW